MSPSRITRVVILIVIIDHEPYDADMAGDESTGYLEEIAHRMVSDYLNQDPELQVMGELHLTKTAELAATELVQRLERAGLSLPPRTRSRNYRWPHTRAVAVVEMSAHPCELMIIRAVSRTWGARQFGCSPNGSVFTADTDGYSWPDSGRRNSLVGISPLLDEVADLFNSGWRRNGSGGRFYERDGWFFDAEDGAIFLELDINEDAEFDRCNPPNKSLWQTVVGWITG